MPKEFSFSRLCDNIRSLNYDNEKTLLKAIEKYKNYTPENQSGFKESLEPKSRYNRKQLNFQAQIKKFYKIIKSENLKFTYKKDQVFFESCILADTFENLGS